MFGLLASTVETTLDVADKLLFEGELPTKREIAKMVDAGITLYSISEVTGLAEDVIRDILND